MVWVTLFANDCGGRSYRTLEQSYAAGGLAMGGMGTAGADAGLLGGSSGGPQGGDWAADPCAEGQQAYQEQRAELMRSYQGSCEMSSDCVLVVEDNPCAYDCAVSVPHVSSAVLTDTLDSLAREYCITCSAPERTACRTYYPFCFVGGCVTLEGGTP
jgi:hypothetical protein